MDYFLLNFSGVQFHYTMSRVKKRFINCPYPIAYTGAWILYLLSFAKVDFREKVQRLCEPRTFSYEDAKRDFGYKPRTFQEGIVQEVKDYINEKY